jgi:hypothetical protein
MYSRMGPKQVCQCQIQRGKSAVCLIIIACSFQGLREGRRVDTPKNTEVRKRRGEGQRRGACSSHHLRLTNQQADPNEDRRQYARERMRPIFRGQ